MSADQPATAAGWRYTLSIEDAMRCMMCRHIPSHEGVACSAPGCLHDLTDVVRVSDER